MSNLHPIFSGIFRSLGYPVDTPDPTRAQRRAAYVKGLQDMNWQFESLDDNRRWERWRDHLVWLREQQIKLDPDGAIWCQHASAAYMLYQPAVRS